MKDLSTLANKSNNEILNKLEFKALLKYTRKILKKTQRALGELYKIEQSDVSTEIKKYLQADVQKNIQEVTDAVKFLITVKIPHNTNNKPFKALNTANTYLSDHYLFERSNIEIAQKILEPAIYNIDNFLSSTDDLDS